LDESEEFVTDAERRASNLMAATINHGDDRDSLLINTSFTNGALIAYKKKRTSDLNIENLKVDVAKEENYTFNKLTELVANVDLNTLSLKRKTKNKIKKFLEHMDFESYYEDEEFMKWQEENPIKVLDRKDCINDEIKQKEKRINKQIIKQKLSRCKEDKT
jgi:hypothetical protein